MIRTNRKIISQDGQDFIVVKLAQAMGPRDRLLVIAPDGENRLIDVKHLDFLGARTRPVVIEIEGELNAKSS